MNDSKISFITIEPLDGGYVITYKRPSMLKPKQKVLTSLLAVQQLLEEFVYEVRGSSVIHEVKES